MRLYFAGTYSREWLFSELADWSNLYVLESFQSIKPWQHYMVKECKGFLLDSGAFSFLKGTASVDWDDYARRYAEYIVEHGITQFFELDIDPIVGLKKVEKIRAMLERVTGIQPIPVWHRSRGKDYYLGMVRDYPYVALGGIALKTWPKKYHWAFPWFVSMAHEHGTQVHALGYSASKVTQYGFDSFDSATWLRGSMAATTFFFSGSSMLTRPKPDGTKLIDSRQIDRHNLAHWIAYQRYLDSEVDDRRRLSHKV